MVSIVKVNTMNTESGVYRVRHRRRNVQGQIITQEKECTGADNFSGMNVQEPTISQEKECMVTIITLEKECIGTDHCTGNLSSSQELSQCLFTQSSSCPISEMNLMRRKMVRSIMSDSIKASIKVWGTLEFAPRQQLGPSFEPAKSSQDGLG